MRSADDGVGSGTVVVILFCSMSSSSSPESAPGLAGGGAIDDDDDDDCGGAAFAPPDFRAIAFMRRLLMPGLMDRAAEADGLFGEEFSSSLSSSTTTPTRPS